MQNNDNPMPAEAVKPPETPPVQPQASVQPPPDLSSRSDKHPDKHGDKIVTEVTFRGNKKLFYLLSRGADIRIGDRVIANIEKGNDLGVVTLKGALAELKKGEVSGHNIIRKANEEDLRKADQIQKDEIEAFRVGKEKVAFFRLDMNLVEVEKQFDESKMTFYFLAEQRVDFRDLVKDMANHFHTRIELRQIGVRDEARRADGVGVCGQRHCCSGFLTTFDQISTQMARTQHLSLNQSKLSGNCGRLKCCLKYELSFYEEMNRCMPAHGSKIKTARGEGRVVGISILKAEVKVAYEGSEVPDILTLDECQGKPKPAPAPEEPDPQPVFRTRAPAPAEPIEPIESIESLESLETLEDLSLDAPTEDPPPPA